MKVVAIIKVLEQVGPYDYYTATRSKVFEGTISVDAIVEWGQRHVPNCKLHDITITEADDAV